MTDPEDVAVREAIAQEDAQDAQEDAQGRSTPPPMDRGCCRCDGKLRPITGVLAGRGFKLRVGICPDCRIDGVGSAAFLTVQDDPVPDVSRSNLERKQEKGTADSPHTAAAYLLDAPPGDYAIRRVRPTELTVEVPPNASAVGVAALYDDADQWTTAVEDGVVVLRMKQTTAGTTISGP